MEVFELTTKDIIEHLLEFTNLMVGYSDFLCHRKDIFIRIKPHRVPAMLSVYKFSVVLHFLDISVFFLNITCLGIIPFGQVLNFDLAKINR